MVPPAREIASDRGGFDAIIELGGEATLTQSVKSIRIGGTIALIGVSPVSRQRSLGRHRDAASPTAGRDA